MKKRDLIIIILVIIIIGILLLVLRGNEDSWIKDNRGVYIKHGNPSLSETPDYVLEQQEVISKAMMLYNDEISKGTELSSQCLGNVVGYAVDIVHVQRTQEDNLPENQCMEYRQGIVSHFIELDKNGEIVRIV